MKTKLKLIRKERNLTQTELGEKIGKTKGVVGNWERETTELMLEDACAICDALHCTLDELAGREVPNRATVDEQKMLKEFRTLDLKQQAIVKQTIHTMTPRYHEDMEKKVGADKAG